MSRCQAIKADGERCKLDAMPDAEWCWSHHPDYQDVRHKRAQKGGRRGGRGRLSPTTIEINEVKQTIREVVADVREGRLPTNRGNTLASLWHVLLRAIEADLKCIEVDLALQERLELTQRLEQLEETLQRQNRGGGLGGYGA